jgi:hypothetical protein
VSRLGAGRDNRGRGTDGGTHHVRVRADRNAGSSGLRKRDDDHAHGDFETCGHSLQSDSHADANHRSPLLAGYEDGDRDEDCGANDYGDDGFGGWELRRIIEQRRARIDKPCRRR